MRSSTAVPAAKADAEVLSCPRTTVTSLVVVLMAVTFTISIVGEFVSVSKVRYVWSPAAKVGRPLTLCSSITVADELIDDTSTVEKLLLNLTAMR